jgi:magnesium transporter
MTILVYLYEADGTEREVDLKENILDEVTDSQLLWINILERDSEALKQVKAALNFEKMPIKGILRTHERPKIYKFKDFYHFYIISVETDAAGKIRPIPIDFLVGKNFVVTVHEGDVRYLQEFTRSVESESHIGDLDAESFVATMLDLHIVSYFRVMEKLEREVDELDDKILLKDLEDDEFIEQMVELRGKVSKLRRWFLPHRDVFYSLSRPDFKEIADSDSFETFKTLNEHFESAVDSIESSRDTVLSLFDLYTTKTSHRMSNTMKRLTFITLMVGGMGVIAGVLGMNFEIEFFKKGYLFWIVVAGMIGTISGVTFIAWKKRWF